MPEDNKPQFPTEVVSLPSKGYYYPKDNPLSSGQVELKYMTAKEEDILTSPGLVNKGIVLDKLLEALIVSKININDVLIGDKNAIILASRILAYGKDYKFEYTDPGSGQKREHQVDLTTLDHKDVDFDKSKQGINEFEFELPQSKKVVTFKLLTHADEKAIDGHLKSMKKITKGGIEPELTTRLKYCILSVDGETDKQYINNFIDNEFLSLDSFAFRTYLTAMTPDVNMACDVELDSGDIEEVTVPMTVGFFWPSSKG